jgi:hypothetical protein
MLYLQIQKLTIMTSLLISATKKTDIKLLTDLANRIGVKVKTLSEDDLLDIGLLKAMEEGRKSEYVSREQVMKKLKR